MLPAGTPTNVLEAIEPSLEATDEVLLTTGAATGFPQTFVEPDPDTRIDNFNVLPNGPFPLKGKNLPYDSYTGDIGNRVAALRHIRRKNVIEGPILTDQHNYMLDW